MNRDELRARVEEILAEQAGFAPSAVGFGSGYRSRGRKRSVAAPRRASMRAMMPAPRASARGRRMLAGEYDDEEASDEYEPMESSYAMDAPAAMPRARRAAGSHAQLVSKLMRQNPGLSLAEASREAKAMRQSGRR